LLIVAAVLVLDVGGRLAFGFQMRRVIVVEAIVFGAAALMLVWAARREQSPRAWRLELWLAVMFGLGSLRAALWSCGLAVEVANLVVLAVGLLAALGFGLWWWVRRRRGPA
jgi:hypothetical protein